MKGGFNKVFRNFAAMKGKTEFDKVSKYFKATKSMPKVLS